jgi:hypothetical protein
LLPGGAGPQPAPPGPRCAGSQPRRLGRADGGWCSTFRFAQRPWAATRPSATPGPENFIAVFR